jgi:hypothetical protein
LDTREELIEEGGNNEFVDASDVSFEHRIDESLNQVESTLRKSIGTVDRLLHQQGVDEVESPMQRSRRQRQSTMDEEQNMVGGAVLTRL